MSPRSLLAALVLMAATTLAQAGRPCEAAAPTAASVQRAMALAERTAAALDASGAQVVVLARAGQNLDLWGLRWSHLGWAYREEPEEPEEPGGVATMGAGSAGSSASADAMGQGSVGTAGRRTGSQPARWRVVHKLNQCGSARGDLYRQGLGDFFLDDLFRFEAAFAVPALAVQAGLLPVLRSNARVEQLHEAAYSMVAYPWALTYQQSNQWAIETLAMARESSVGNRRRAQAWLQFQGYEPTTLRISPLQRLGARLTSAHIAFDDHPDAKRYSGRIETVTVDSVFDWLERSGLAGAVQVVP